MDFGLGIEHEVNYFHTQTEFISGRKVKKMFGNNQERELKNRKYSYIKRMFENINYEVVTRYPTTRVYFAIKYVVLPRLMQKLGKDPSKSSDYFTPGFSVKDVELFDKAKIKEETYHEINRLGDQLYEHLDHSEQTLRFIIFFIQRATLDWSNIGLYMEFVFVY